MSYERIVEIMQNECERKGISHYRLSQIAAVPISTIYGVFRNKNKARIDTLDILLDALGLQMSITSKESNTNEYTEPLEAWAIEAQRLPYDKQILIKKLVLYLKE